MSEISARLSLPYLLPAQAQKHVTHNEALERLDLLVQLSVQEFGAETPPDAPQEGQIWALGAEPSGAWAGQGGRLAGWSAGEWSFVVPAPGWIATQGSALRIWDGAQWGPADLPALQNLGGMGIQTSHDATNRLAVAAEATLLTHAGAGHQLKINKNAASDTASLLFQTGWAGRAEMGTTGGDGFAIKVSADGIGWHDALIVDPGTGSVSLPQGLTVGGSLSLPAGSLDLAANPAFQGQVPLARGGTGAGSAAQARSNLGLGSAASADVTASATDAAAGRLLRTGDGGINGVSPLAGDLNANPAGGIYSYDVENGSGNGPRRLDNDAPHARGTVIAAGRFGDSRRTQIFVSETLPWRGELYTRAKDSAWPADVMTPADNSRWHRHYSTLNLLAAVSQSAGIPTGGVFQIGSSTNGRFERRASGQAFCARDDLSVTGASTALGTLFRSANIVWTFPSAFLAGSLPVLSVSAAHEGVIGHRIISISDSVVTFQLVAATSITGTIVCRAAASGRWSNMT